MYHDTPFHNYQHAFHVFQNCMLFLTAIPELQDSLTSLDAFSLLVAALCHDMDHTGAHPPPCAHPMAILQVHNGSPLQVCTRSSLQVRAR
jgi:hypothetical protein